MVALIDRKVEKKALKLIKGDEFQKYLSEQCLKTTFNGIEVAEFSWYKKLLGLNGLN